MKNKCIVECKVLDSRVGNDFLMPNYSTEGSSALDLIACIDKPINLIPMKSVLVSTGISIYISNPNITAIILPRSGLGHKDGVVLGNTIGLIDSDYQGELMISMLNRKKTQISIYPGSRIAQMVFIPILRPEFKIVKDFKKKTNRFSNGFGHTGVY